MTQALAKKFDRLCTAVLAGLFLVLVANAFGLRTWPFELLSHFVFQYLLAASVLCLLFLVSGKITAAATAFVFALIFAADYQKAPQTLADAAPTPIGMANAAVIKGPGLPSRRLSLMTFNVSEMNPRPEKVEAWLATRPAEIIALQEIPSGMAAALDNVKDAYPHQYTIEPGARLNSEVYTGDETLALLSIHPITALAVVRPSGQGKLSLLAHISVPDAEDPWIAVIHPSDPDQPARLAARDSYLLDLAGVIAELDGPVIVAGDFNMTPYAPTFRLFLGASRMSTSRSFPATWPAVLGSLGLPIDHVLVRDARLTSLQALASMGSDHRVLKAEILLPASFDEQVYAGRP